MNPSVSTAGTTPAVTLPSWLKPIALILAVGFLVRLLFLSSTGFHNDVAAFEAWTLTLKDNPPWDFYAKTSFADYPPGYFIVLWFLAGVYHVLGNLHVINTNDGQYFALRILVKLPALVMDLVDTLLIYSIAKRFASQTIALVAAALFALNPATIYVSAYWGQVDSVSWGFVLLAIWFALRSADVAAKTTSRIVWAWVAMAFSILIKPQGALVAVVLLAFAFAPLDATERMKRLRATGLGILAAFAIALAVAVLFHPTFNPIGAFAWLIERYRVGSTVYAYNTVNAFNLYAIKQPFWQSDTAQLQVFNIALGPMYLWGIILVLAAAALIVARYLQERTDKAFVEGCMLVAFAFFTLATRMHERYSFGAFLLAFPLLAFGRRRLWAIVVLTFTTLLNLIYSFAYQTVMETHPAGVDATNLWGMGSHFISAVNVALFFALGYVYLGGSIGAMDTAESDFARLAARVRGWFDPREGIFAMLRIDWLLAFAFSVASFVLCRTFLQWPDEKIFDEIYYARAGEEYLKHLEIFEFTHPPLTKLVVTLSMMLHGGLEGGDSGIGWRFLNVVVGALMVGVIYLFAKRITGSTLFASISAGMLLFDGFHFVQSRIATPEITVAFFSLTTVYAFYRVWTASGARLARVPLPSRLNAIVFAVFLGVGALVAAGVATFLATYGPHTRPFEWQRASWIVAFLWTETLFYLAARWYVARYGDSRLETSYADGSRVLSGAVMMPEGDTIRRTGGSGELLSRDADAAARTYFNDGRMAYATPAGSAATFQPNGSIVAADGSTSPREMWIWLGLLAVSSGCLAASKWNGLFDFFVVWLCVAGVVAQRFWRRPAIFGNPFGMPIDVIVGVMLVVSGAIYTASYIPFFLLGHNFMDMVALQTEMFGYHDHLVATHPYSSVWWQWPILERPISYYYHDFRVGAAAQDSAACCVAEILALPNPFIWWAGLLTVPVVAVLAWLQRNRAYALLVIAYVLQWLPWIGSPRIAFEYHFFPNLAIIILCNAIVLQKIWNWRLSMAWPERRMISGRQPEFDPRLPAFARATFNGGPEWLITILPRVGVGVFLAVCLWAFFFFYPVLSGEHVTWQAWSARMWIGRWII